MKHLTFERYTEMCKKLTLTGFKDYQMEELLSTLFFDIESGYITKISIIRSLLSTLFVRDFKYHKKGKGSIIFFFTHSYGERMDYKMDMKNVLECTNNYIFAESYKNYGIRLSRIRMLPLIKRWMKEVETLPYSNTVKLYLCIKLLMSYIASDEIETWILKKKYRPVLCVTFCDVHMIDYIITKRMNKSGITTATLQHATFTEMIGRYAYVFSRSDFFLVNNQYAKDEAIKSGYLYADKMIICGPLKYIKNRPVSRDRLQYRRVIGIALGGSSQVSKRENKQLISLAKNIAAGMDIHIIFRYHPGFVFDLPDMGRNKFYSVCEPEVSLQEFARKCDIVLTGSSNVFVDLINIECPTYRLTSQINIYPELGVFFFNNEKELFNIIQTYYEKNMNDLNETMRMINHYFLPAFDIAENYKKFFEQYDR